EASMAWSKGQPWRTVRSLDRLNEQIRAAHPQAVPPATPATSWGSIADSAHSSTSDHYPHVYSALGKTAVVCARDFPHAPKLGLDAHKIAEELRQSRDPRIGYIISNGRITGPNYGWAWSAYRGSDPHDTHIHVSTVHTAVADSGADWQIGDEDMPLSDADVERVATAAASKVHGQKIGKSSYTIGQALDRAYHYQTKLDALAAAMSALAGRDLVDEQAVAEQLAPLLLAGLSPEKIAAAIPPQIARDVADELAARLQG
ncbi:hypothetical protein ACFWC6_33370, partial [Micromonospora chalcea]